MNVRPTAFELEALVVSRDRRNQSVETKQLVDGCHSIGWKELGVHAPHIGLANSRMH